MFCLEVIERLYDPHLINKYNKIFFTSNKIFILLNFKAIKKIQHIIYIIYKGMRMRLITAYSKIIIFIYIYE
jgi:hypothetical protein